MFTAPAEFGSKCPFVSIFHTWLPPEKKASEFPVAPIISNWSLPCEYAICALVDPDSLNLILQAWFVEVVLISNAVSLADPLSIFSTPSDAMRSLSWFEPPFAPV